MSFDAERFFKMVGNVSRQEVTAAKQDKTIVAKIISVENADAGKYKVEYQGNRFFASSTNPTVVYRVGEQVYVLVPQGDFSAEKIILGYSSYQANEDRSEGLKNFYIDVGPNWVDQSTNGWAYVCNRNLGIVAASENDVSGITHPPANWEDIGFSTNRNAVPTNPSTKQRKTRYPSVDSNASIAHKEVAALSQSCEYIHVSAEFKTDFAKRHTDGRYGLRVLVMTYAEKDENAEPIIKTFDLGFASFTGAPYNYTQWTKQEAYFQVPQGSVVGLCEVSLVQEGMETDYPLKLVGNVAVNDTSKPMLSNNNIMARNLDIRFADKINLADTQWYTYVSTPRGTRLSTEGAQTITLVPHLLHYGEDIFDTKNCEAWWFREMVGATIADVEEADKDEHNITWFDLGGNGWYPIKKMIDQRSHYSGEWGYNTTTQESEWTPAYVLNEDGSLDIKIGAVPFKWRYKLVIVYRDTSGETYQEIGRFSPTRPTEVVNASSQYALELERYIADLRTLLRIRDYNKDPYAVGSLYREWFGTYWMEGLDGSYIQISNEYHPLEHQPFPFDITNYLSANMARFHVACYDPYIADPQYTGAATVKCPEVANLTVDYINDDTPELIVTWEGRDTFNYDAAGKVKSWTVSKDNVLKPSLHWFTDSVAAYSIRILGPDGIQLTSRSTLNEDYYDVNGEESTYNSSNSMMTSMYIDQDYCIHFKIREKYDEAKLDNTFKIEISLNSRSEPYYANKEVQFIKDGDQGTIGGEWAAPIFPCNFVGSEGSEVPFKEKLDSQQTVPLVVHMSKNVLAAWEQNDSFRLALRPFVTKNGVHVEDMDPYEGYFYRCYWDVRTPSWIANDKAKLASFLRLYHVTSRTALTTDNNHIFKSNENSMWNMGNVGTGRTEYNKNENHPDGLVGFTVFPAEQYSNIDDDSLPSGCSYTNENFGAVEVRFFDNRQPKTSANGYADADGTLSYMGTGASIEDMLYRFVVKCQVEIFKGQYDQEKQQIQTHGNAERVATITSFYPVDMVFTYQDEGDFLGSYTTESANSPLYRFDKLMQLNWPQYVKYNPTGYDPETRQDKEGLYLVIGDKDKSTLKNYEVENLTPLIQEVADKVDSATGKITKQVYTPSGHLNMTEGFTGVLRTKPGEGFFGDNDRTSFFVRNQVMYLDSYGNVDINAWDGQGIDMNEDDGTIFAATVGAGFKEATTNTFTGVLMGIDKSQPRDKIKGYNGTYDSDYIKDHPYLAGLFGYQDGVSSFGIMENGTGFFGRADRGGRIIFDGSNATIYGGANGMMSSPQIGDPMWNSMRLSFVDLTHAASKLGKAIDGYWTQGRTPVYTSVKGANGEQIVQGFDGAYFKDGNAVDGTPSDRMPKWYRKLWETAYIKPKGKFPYWYRQNTSSTINGKSIEEIYAALPPLTNLADVEKGSGRDSGNFKINYYHPENSEQWFEAVTADTLQTYQNRMDWAKTQYQKDPTGTYPADYVSETDLFLNSELRNKTKKSVYQAARDQLSQTRQLTGFGASRASTTPAIEIGQHIPGLMPGIFEWSDYESIFKELRIPGDRNFMVTYDGTMWAMNGIFMGVIIGSNFIGGRIQGAEIGIGNRPSTTTTVRVIADNTDCDYSQQQPPLESEELISNILTGIGNGGDRLGFYVSPAGEVVAKNIYMYGGKIDIGHFHIARDGHLTQVGHSDFVGETHCYGGLAITPSANYTSAHQGSNYGNLFQTRGRVALGIIQSSDNDIGVHTWMVDTFWDTSRVNSYYTASQAENNNPGIGGHTFEQSAIFGIDTSVQSYDNGYQAHFWPLSYRFKKMTDNNYAAYATTMNMFKNDGMTVINNSINSALQASNYFRIGPWGTEGMMHFIRDRFQDERYSSAPSNNAASDGGKYWGWFGLVDRNSTSDEPALGISTWNKAPIILKSDGNISLRSAGFAQFLGNWSNSNPGRGKNTNNSLDFNSCSFGYNVRFGTDAGEYSGTNGMKYSDYAHNQIFMTTAKGLISIATLKNDHFEPSQTAMFPMYPGAIEGESPWSVGITFDGRGDDQVPSIRIWAGDGWITISENGMSFGGTFETMNGTLGFTVK